MKDINVPITGVRVRKIRIDPTWLPKEGIAMEIGIDLLSPNYKKIGEYTFHSQNYWTDKNPVEIPEDVQRAARILIEKLENHAASLVIQEFKLVEANNGTDD